MCKKLIIGLGMMIAAMIYVNGCHWDDTMFNKYVIDGEMVVFCPPDIDGITYNGDKVDKILFHTVICEENSVSVNPIFSIKHPIAFSLNSDADKCIQANQCLPKEECEGCEEYLLDYLSCRNFQSNGFFELNKSAVDAKPSKIEYVGSYENILFEYPDSVKYGICPADYPICSYHSNHRSSSLDYGCIEKGGEIVQCMENQIVCNIMCISPETSLENCGASLDCIGKNAGKKCAKGGYCAKGKCECLEGQVDCDGICIDPLSNDQYCGAGDGCSNYHACLDNAKCLNGKCIIYQCNSGMLCPSNDDSMFQCVNINNDKNNCGGCGHKCDSGCIDGQCDCNVGFKRCPSQNGNGLSECRSISSDSDCGDCNYRCPYGYHCEDAQCVKSDADCPSNVCSKGNLCENSDNRCGTTCRDCKSIPYVDNGVCVNGICKFTCKQGYEYNNGLCVDKCQIYDLDTLCKNQNNITHWVDGKCVAGQCTPTKCDAGYIPRGNNCVPFCNIEHSKIVIINNEDCQIVRCEDNYHVFDGKCVQNSRTQCALPVPDSKIDNCFKKGWKNAECQNGICTLIECDKGMVNVDGRCVQSKSRYQCICQYNDTYLSLEGVATIQCLDKLNNKCGWLVTDCLAGYTLKPEYAQKCPEGFICYNDKYYNLCKK